MQRSLLLLVLLGILFEVLAVDDKILENQSIIIVIIMVIKYYYDD